MILTVNTYANVILERCAGHIGVYESILPVMKQIWTQINDCLFSVNEQQKV